MKQIALHGKHGEGRYALVDDQDYERFSHLHWYAKRKGSWSYVVAADGRGGVLYLHREVAGDPLASKIDHINGHTFDNRRSNLRAATNAQNCRNQRQPLNSRSPYKWVYWYADRRTWRCQIMVDYQKINLGNYDNAQEAAYVYDQVSLQLFTAFSKSGEHGQRVASHPLGAGGQRRGRRPERAPTTQQVEGGGAQQPDNLSPGMALEDMAILAEAVVLDPEELVLDPPMPSGQRQQLGRPGLLRPEAGCQVARLLGHLPGLQDDHALTHLSHLVQTWEGGNSGQLR